MQYKWYTSAILTKLSNHLEKYHFMQIDQRGAKQKCDNQVVDLAYLQTGISGVFLLNFC